MTTDRPTSDLRWSGLTADAVEQWSALTKVLGEVDGTGEVYEPEDLAEELEEHGFTPETDSVAIWDGDRLVGYGQVRVGMNANHEGIVRCQLSGGIHPDWRRRGLGTALMDRMEKRANELAAERHPDRVAHLRASGELDGSPARRLLTRRGYAVVRYFNDLARDLPGAPVEVPVVSDASLITPTVEHEAPLRTAHNIAFADHWSTAEVSREGWHDYWTGRSNRWDVSTLALGQDGSVLSYVMASQWVPRRLYITIVGTRPEARGQGLAAACLTRTLRLAADTGEYDVVELTVDSDSPTGATRLYERLGFTTHRTMAAMQKRPDEGVVSAV